MKCNAKLYLAVQLILSQFWNSSLILRPSSSVYLLLGWGPARLCVCVCVCNNVYPSAHKGFFQSLYVCLFLHNMCVLWLLDWGGSCELVLDTQSNRIRGYTNSETAQRYKISLCQAGLVKTSVVRRSGGRIIIHKHRSRLKQPQISRHIWNDSLGASSPA